MAISGIGIAFNLAVGGKALYNLAKRKECSESKNLSLPSVKLKNMQKIINSYLQLLEHDAADLLQMAI